MTFTSFFTSSRLWFLEPTTTPSPFALMRSISFSNSAKELTSVALSASANKIYSPPDASMPNFTAFPLPAFWAHLMTLRLVFNFLPISNATSNLRVFYVLSLLPSSTTITSYFMSFLLK